MRIKQAHKLILQTHRIKTADSFLAGNLEGKLCGQQLGNAKLLPRFHLKAQEYLIQMDVVEQTEGYLTVLKVRKVAKDESINKKREQQQLEEDGYQEGDDDNDGEDDDNDGEDDDDDDNKEENDENDSGEKKDASDS